MDRNRPAILFVCTGNICRSPTAEGLFRNTMKQWSAALDWPLDSAGIGAQEGLSPTPEAIEVAADLGADISALRSRRIVDEDFTRFDFLVAMDAGHLDYLEVCRPPSARAALIGFATQAGGFLEVPDPYGRSMRAYRRSGQLISAGVERLFHFLVTRPEADGHS